MVDREGQGDTQKEEDGNCGGPKKNCHENKLKKWRESS